MNKIENILIHHGTREIPKFEFFKKQIRHYLIKGPVLVINTCPYKYKSEVARLSPSLHQESRIISLPLKNDEESYAQLLETLQTVANSFDFKSAIVVCGEELASTFPLYLLIHGLKAKDINTNISNVVEEGETVVVSVRYLIRRTLTMPGNSVVEHVFGGATYMR